MRHSGGLWDTIFNAWIKENQIVFALLESFSPELLRQHYRWLVFQIHIDFDVEYR